MDVIPSKVHGVKGRQPGTSWVEPGRATLRRDGGIDGSTVVLGVATAFYILSVFLVSAIPGLSRLVHVGIALIAAALLMRTMAGPLRLRVNPMLVGTFVFLGFAAASILWAPNQGAALVRWISLAVHVLGATSVVVALWNGITLRFVGLVVALGATSQAAVAVYEFALGEASRVGGLTGNANSLALQLSIALFVLLLAFPSRRWPHVLGLTLIVIATVVSGSRKIVFVWLAYFLVLARVIGVRIRTSAMFVGLALMLVPVLLVASSQLGPGPGDAARELVVVQRIERALQGQDSSVNTRAAMIRDALELWSESPYVGRGIDQYRYVASFRTYSHNNYAELLVSFGLVGFALYYGLLSSLLVVAVRRAWLGSTAGWTLMSLVILLLLVDVAMVSFMSRTHWLLLLLAGYVAFDTDDDAPPSVHPAADAR